MRKTLLSMLLVSLISVVAFAAKEDSYLLYQGFEEGSISESWTQEYVAGQTAWTVTADADMTYPTGAYKGAYSATLRNTTVQTQHYVTRLVSPVIDLSEAFQPILVFSHAQPQRTGDIDTLRVYYRTSAEGRWVKLAEYNKKITSWQTDTIDLTGASTTYQICFEGTDNFGRGISLDEIIVRPMPTCDDPSNIMVDGLTTNSATLRWNGSLDTDSFHVVLSTKPINDIASAEDSAIVLNTYVYDFVYVFTGLARNKTHYAYLQANCGMEESEWVGTSFTTKNLASLPYSQSFNLNYAANQITHVAYWSYGTSIKKDDGSMEYMPFVNQNAGESSWGNYSYSNTTCLAFTGARNLSTAIPAGEYVYAATPEIDIDRIQDAMVTFWGTSYSFYGDEYAAGLIVGVMTDPADYSTFVPVDTVYVKGARSFYRYDVHFSAYTGEGKYIAFSSDFLDKDNFFFLDEVEIKAAPAVPAASNVEITAVGSQSITVNVDANGAPQVKIVVAKDTADARTGAIWMTPQGLPSDYILAEQTINANQLPYTITGLTGGRFVQVYATTVDGTTEGGYALPEKVLMPYHWNGEDLLIDFEQADNDWMPSQLNNFSRAITATYMYPVTIQYPLEQQPGLSSSSYYYVSRYGAGSLSSINYGHNAKGCVMLKSERREFGDGRIWTPQYGGQGIALPEVDTIQNLVLKFYLKCYSTTNPTCSRVRVGVVEDPRDFSTFQEVAVFDGTGSYRSCVASFANYTGNGHYPVILSAPSAVEQKGGTGSGSGGSYTDYTTSYNLVDDVTMMGLGGCLPPAAVAINAQDTVATVTWSTNGMTEWVVRLYQGSTMKDSALVTAPTYTFRGLAPHTKYTYSVVTRCGDVLTDVELNEFTTECAPAETVPYFEGFEGLDKYGSALDADAPACWYFPRYLYSYSGGGESSTSYYPYISKGATYAHSGAAGLYWYYYSTSVLPTDGVLALPRMNATVNALQLSFWMKPSNANYAADTIYVGAMTDPSDYTTFDTVAAIRVGAAEWRERVVRFENYTGNGQYIALRRPRATAAHLIYLDDFRVDSLSSCEKVMDVTAKNMSEQGATFTWTSQSSSQWEVVIAKKDTTLGSTVAVEGCVLADNITTDKPYTFSGCPTANTQYYVYVRAICGEGNKGEWSQPCVFKTTCVPVTAGQFGTETFSTTDAIDCWTVGVREGTTANPSRQATYQCLYMFNSAASDGAYAIMPMLDIDSVNRLQISFDAHGGTGAAYLREVTVGVISNPSDLSTFSAVKTVSLPKVSATTATTDYGFKEGQRFTVRFDEYEGDYNGDFGKQIMFLSESGALANYVYIDNVSIDTIPACKEPLEITLVEANANDLTITWDSLGGEFEVKLAQGSTVVKDTIVTANTLMIDGLTMLKEYSAQVRHICGAGDTSIWSNVRKFKTSCPATYPLPYSENFDSYASGAANYPSCWERYSNSTTTYPYVYSTAKNGTTGNGLYLYRTTSYNSYAVLPVFDASLKDVMISFDYRNANATTYNAYFILGVATDVTSAAAIDSTLTVLDSVQVLPYKTPNNVWYTYSKSLTSYTGEGQIVLIAPKADVSTNSGAVYLDNLYVERIPSCFRPTGFAFASATASSVTLSWTPAGDETAWDIAYVAKGGNVADATIVTVDTIPGVVTGLATATEYDFYVRANCGAGDASNWTDLVSASTLYRVDLADAHWNFDDNDQLVQSPLSTSATYKLQRDWITGNSVSSSSTNNPYVMKNTYNTVGNKTRNSHYSRSDSCALRIYSATTAAGSYAIMPEVNANLDTLQLHFFGRSCYATGSKVAEVDSVYYLLYATNTSTTKYPHAIKIGTVTDPYDVSTFELITEYVFEDIPNDATNKSTIVDDAHWEEVIVPLYGAKGKYVTFLSDYTTAANYVWIDDVVLEKESGCANPSKLEATNIEATSASFAWGSSKSQWNVKVEDGSGVVAQAVVTDRAWTATGLTAHSSYTFSVQAVCSAEETSDWVSMSFLTPCAAFDSAALATSFASDLEPYFGNATYNLPGCWDGGQLTKASATIYTYMPQAIANTAVYQYGRSLGTTDRALRFNHSTTYGDSYVILPAMDFSLDSTALHFWMRAAYFYTPTYTTASNRNRLYGANSAYEKNLVIGAIADPSDMTTFVALDTVTYSQSWTATTGIFTTGDESGNDYWEEVTLPLKKYAGKGRLVLFYPSNGKTSYMFVDDLSIVGADFCASASGLRVSNLKSHSATLNWVIAGKDSVQVQVAKNSSDFNAEEIVVDTVLNNANGTYNVSDLIAGQDYYFRVKHFCSAEEEADWTVSQLFVTNYEVRFVENLAETRTYPVDWERHGGVPADVFAGTADLTTVAETGTNWQRAIGGAMGLNTIYANTSTGTSTTSNYWLVSPVIDLTSIAATDSLMLTFKAALTSSSNGIPNPSADDDVLIIAVSEDAGATWTSENATVIADASLPFEGRLVNVEMTKYVGKQVKFAFVSSSTKTGTKNRVHVAAITLNRYTATEYEAQICQWNDYADRYFAIDADDLVVGQTTIYARYDRAAAADHMTTMNLTVSKDTTVYLQATICEGENYMLDGFNITDAKASYTYRQKLEGANTCDSIVELNLTVLPRIRTNFEQTICQGDFYEFNGVRYYTNTIHTDTLQSLVTGCDSIVTLYLTVNAILRGEEEVHLCPGETYSFGKYGAIAEAGTYSDTLQNALGCDSVATITVSLHETAATTVRGLICQGETYNESVWAGLNKAGDYPSQQQTVYGCDSIVTLHLLVADATLSVTDSISVEALPYVLNGVELLPVGTEDGVYVKQVQLSCGTASVTIVVGTPSSLHTVMANSLGVTPNPAAVGEQIRVLGNFPMGSDLRVFSATGALIYETMTAAEEIVIPGMPAAGAYLVTLSVDGNLYQSKLVVR